MKAQKYMTATLVKTSPTRGTLTIEGKVLEIDTSRGQDANARDVMTQANRAVEREGWFVQEWSGPSIRQDTGQWVTQLGKEPMFLD